MFAKKVKVKFPCRCSNCSEKMEVGKDMILMVYYPMFFDRFRREVVKGEKTTSFLCISCLRNMVNTCEEEGMFSPQSVHTAKLKRLRAGLKKGG